MNSFSRFGAAALVTAGLLVTPLAGSALAATVGTGGGSYSIGTPTLAQVSGAPWQISQGDPSLGAPYGASLPTYTPPASGTANLALYPVGGNNASRVAGTPGPLDGYCGTGGPNPESGPINVEPASASVGGPVGDMPMAPYYFPYVTRINSSTLLGYFDYRPKDTDEAIAVATSTDNGVTWTTQGKALDQNAGWCANGDSNDNGQGHPFAMTINGNSNLYTLSRPTGDFLGVNMLVHPLDTANPTNPLDKLPASQPAGVDPDQVSTGTVTVAGSPVTLNLGSIGVGPEQLVAGSFVDLTTSSPVFACTGVSGSSLTGCTSSGSVAVATGDTIEQVIATVATGATIPTATTTASTTSLTFSSYASASIQTFVGNNASPGGRFFIDGNPVYCVEGSSPFTTWTQCRTPNAAFPAKTGDAITTDPVVPAGVTQATGLISPDGMVGVVPNYPGTPAGQVAVMYGEKIDSYYAPTTTTAKVTLPVAGNSFTLPVASTSGISTPVSLTLGDNTSGGFATAACTSETTTSFTCTSTTSGDSISNSSSVGIPGACTATSSALAQIGEGSTKSTTLYKNNEDYTVLRIAFTADGVNFTDAGIVDGGQDLNNPAQTSSPSATSPLDLPQGATDSPGLRFVGSRGTIVTNSDGSLGLFMSGAWCTDGDSDAFNQIFYSQSTNGGSSWSTPQVVLSTDYTFSAREQQDSAATPTALNISGYYNGRAYGPTVVPNSDGSLTMVFAGYSSPKPLPTVAALGNQAGGAPQWTLSAKDPALYRNILTMTLTPTPATSVPESPFTAALPISALGVGVVWLASRRRKRRRLVTR